MHHSDRFARLCKKSANRRSRKGVFDASFPGVGVGHDLELGVSNCDCKIYRYTVSSMTSSACQDDRVDLSARVSMKR